MADRLIEFAVDERGIASLEYALLLAMVAAAAASAAVALGAAVSGRIDTARGDMQ